LNHRRLISHNSTMRKSDLKRTLNIFDDFKFHDEPEVVKPPENALKFRKLAHEAAVHSLLSDDEIGNARLQPQKSLSKTESSQDSPWLEKRNAYDISDAAKAQNIARAQEQRKRQAKNEPMNLPSTHKFQKYLEESGEVTRFRDDIPKTNNLDRILSKSNLIRSSLLNKNLEDLEEFDPLDKVRNKANKQKEMERKERLQNRENIHQNWNSSSVARKQKRFSLDDDSDEDEEEASNFIRPQQQQKRKAKNTIVLDDDDDDEDEFDDNEEEVEDRLEDSFQLEDTPQQEGKSFQKLSKKGGIHQQQQKISKSQQPIFLSDSDEEKQPKKKQQKQQQPQSKKSKKASKASSESSEDEFRDTNNNEEDEDDGGDGNNWQDEELSENELKQKAFAIITQCENLAKNLKSSLLKWESKANQHKEQNNSQIIASPANITVVSTTTTPVVQSKMKDCVNLIDIGADDDDDNDDESGSEGGGEEDEDYHHEGMKKRAAASSGLLMNTPTHNHSHQDSVHHAKHHSKLINNAEIHSLCPELTLNSYQLVGVNWMRLLYQNNMNGVLADDMGLGKTIQTIAFLTYLSKSTYLPKTSEKYRLPHLIIVPASVLSNWENEFHKFAPSMTLLKYHGTQNERNELKYQIKSMVKNGELNVLLTNYTIFERESSKNDRAFLLSLSFHFTVLDEAHAIKNINSSRYMHINNLQSYNRLLLSGTPVQNNIMELLSLLSFLMPKIFVKENCELLVHVFGWDNNGSGKRNNNNNNSDRLNELKSILFPFVLRRLKSDVLNQLTEKKIVTVKLPLTDYQRKVYDQMIEQFMAKKRQTEMDMLKQKEIDERNEIKVNTKKKLKKSNGLAIVNSPASKQQQEIEEIIDLSETPIQKEKGAKTNTEIVKIDDDFFSSSDILTTSAAKHLFTALRKVCNHPLLLRLQYNSKDIEKIANIALQEEYFGKQCSLQQVIQEMTGKFSDYDIHQLCLLYSYSLSSLILNEENLFQCNKINYLKELLPSLVQDDHRVLLFSQWTKILDILEILMNYLNYQFVRLDGSTPIKERQEIIDEFNENQEIKIFLLSTKAGGLGINLTSADTVVLHDLDFNPENDRQAEVHQKNTSFFFFFFSNNFSHSFFRF
jgi:SNF2 family DNA or RNA helicase